MKAILLTAGKPGLGEKSALGRDLAMRTAASAPLIQGIPVAHGVLRPMARLLEDGDRGREALQRMASWDTRDRAAGPWVWLLVLGAFSATGCAGGVEELGNGPEDTRNQGDMGRDLDAASPSCPLKVTPSVVDFGNVLAGTAATGVIELRNARLFSVPLEFIPGANVGVCEDRDGSVFCLPTRRFNAPLGASETIRLQPRFQPGLANGAEATEEKADFILRAGDPSCDLQIQLRGFTVNSPLGCTPNPFDFGPVNPQEAADGMVICSAVANRAVTVLGATLSSASSPDFEQAPALMPVLLQPPFDGNPGGTVAIPVSYAPATLGEDRGRLVVEFEAEGATKDTVEVPLLGNGGGPNILVRRIDIDFKRSVLGIPSARELLISNVGFEDLRYAFEIDTLGVGAFSLPEGGSGVLHPGTSRLLRLEFRPEDPQLYETVARLSTNDPDDPGIEISVRGEGVDLLPCQLEVDPPGNVLSFTLDGLTQQSQTIELRNLSRTDPCLVMRARLSETSDVEFQLPGGDLEDRLLAPLEVFPLAIAVNPSSAGTFEGLLLLSFADSENPNRSIDLVAFVGP